MISIDELNRMNQCGKFLFQSTVQYPIERHYKPHLCEFNAKFVENTSTEHNIVLELKTRLVSD